jgi:hypothetical protein
VLDRTIKKLRMFLKSPRHIGVEGAKDSTLAEDNEDVQQMARPGAAPSDVSIGEAAAQGTSGAGGTLPHFGIIQQAFGSHDISGVRAHTGSAAREAAQSMGAEAFATGSDIAFAGQASLHTAAHEAAHVVQQRAGVALQGGVGRVGDRYERHADQVADAVVAGQSAEQLLNQFAGPARGAGGSVQRQASNVQMARNNNSNTTNSNSDRTNAPSAGAGANTAAPAPPPPYRISFASESFSAKTGPLGASANHTVAAVDNGSVKVEVDGVNIDVAVAKAGVFEVFALNGDDAAVKATASDAKQKYRDAKDKAATQQAAAESSDKAADAMMKATRDMLAAVTEKTCEALAAQFGDSEATKRLGWVDDDPQCSGDAPAFKAAVVAKLLKDQSTGVYDAMKAEAVNYLFRGKAIDLADVRTKKGVTRVMDLPSLYKYGGYLQAAKKEVYNFGADEDEKLLNFLFDANANSNFDPNTHLNGGAEIQGQLAQAWWGAAMTSTATDLQSLIKQFDVDQSKYSSGAVQLDFELQAAMRHRQLRKPTAYDGMGHPGYKPNLGDGELWGATTSGALEAVAPPIPISMTSNKTFHPGSAAYTPFQTASETAAGVGGGSTRLEVIIVSNRLAFMIDGEIAVERLLRATESPHLAAAMSTEGPVAFERAASEIGLIDLEIDGLCPKAWAGHVPKSLQDKAKEELVKAKGKLEAVYRVLKMGTLSHLDKGLASLPQMDEVTVSFDAPTGNGATGSGPQLQAELDRQVGLQVWNLNNYSVDQWIGNVAAYGAHNEWAQNLDKSARLAAARELIARCAAKNPRLQEKQDGYDLAQTELAAYLAADGEIDFPELTYLHSSGKEKSLDLSRRGGRGDETYFGEAHKDAIEALIARYTADRGKWEFCKSSTDRFVTNILHNPDQIAGGYFRLPDVRGLPVVSPNDDVDKYEAYLAEVEKFLGPEAVNKSIGAQWKDLIGGVAADVTSKLEPEPRPIFRMNLTAT